MEVDVVDAYDEDIEDGLEIGVVRWQLAYLQTAAALTRRSMATAAIAPC